MALKEFHIWLYSDDESNCEVLKEQGFSELEIEDLCHVGYEVKVIGVYDTETHKYVIKEWLEI